VRAKQLTTHLLLKPDINKSEDIRTLIDSFYDKVKSDEVIGYIFNDVAQVDWVRHLPRMYAFWEFLLLGKDTYQGNPMEVHQKLHQQIKLTEQHFDQWLISEMPETSTIYTKARSKTS
jgi:hemoglobin